MAWILFTARFIYCPEYWNKMTKLSQRPVQNFTVYIPHLVAPSKNSQHLGNHTVMKKTACKSNKQHWK